MGKRSHFPRRPKDSYDTPSQAVAPLLHWLSPSVSFVEPCAGDGFLAGHLKRAGHICIGAFDLPDDARSKTYDVPAGAVFITNPPYWGCSADLNPLIVNLSNQAPAWLLLPGDWPYNVSSAVLLRERARLIVAVGRVKWIPGSEFTAMDNCAWILFERLGAWATTRFVGRLPLPHRAELFGAPKTRKEEMRGAT
jgi:hypothetical protein